MSTTIVARDAKKPFSPGRSDYLKTWAVWRNLSMYFCVFSVVGHWAEIGYGMLVRVGVLPGMYDAASEIWINWFYPFWMYGFGTVVCVLALFPLKTFLQKRFRSVVASLTTSFIVNTLACVGIELIAGLLFNQPRADGSLPLWDYQNMFCNFMGQICLQTALAFGFAATLFTWVVYPKFEALLQCVPAVVLNRAALVITATFCILLVL